MQRLEQAGEPAARQRITDIAASPAPKILLGIEGDRLDVPIAIAGRFGREMKASSQIVSVSNDVMRRKVAKHAFVDVDRFALVQQVIDEGATVDEGRGENRRTVVALIDDVWWKLVLTRTARGILRVATFFRTNSKEIERLKRRAEERR